MKILEHLPNVKIKYYFILTNLSNVGFKKLPYAIKLEFKPDDKDAHNTGTFSGFLCESLFFEAICIHNLERIGFFLYL